jgi:hypothetical protein
MIRALLARCVAALLFEAQCLRFGVPGLSWRIRRARMGAFRRQWLCDPGNQEAAALAGVAAGEQVFIAELIPAIRAYQAKRATSFSKSGALSIGPDRKAANEVSTADRSDGRHPLAAWAWAAMRTLTTRQFAGHVKHPPRAAVGGDTPNEEKTK